MPKTYDLVKLEDLLQVPADRREACMREVLYALALHDLAIGDGQSQGWRSVSWTDDDDMRIDLHFGGGEPMLTLQITPGPDGKPATSAPLT